MDRTAIIDKYCEAWSDPNEARRAELLGDVWAPQGTYTDPTGHAEGTTGLLAHITGVMANFPGARILRTSALDEHHGVARFAWRLEQPAGEGLPEGLDIVFFSADGTKIERIIGFFGPIRKAKA